MMHNTLFADSAEVLLRADPFLQLNPGYNSRSNKRNVQNKQCQKVESSQSKNPSLRSFVRGISSDFATVSSS